MVVLNNPKIPKGQEILFNLNRSYISLKENSLSIQSGNQLQSFAVLGYLVSNVENANAINISSHWTCITRSLKLGEWYLLTVCITIIYLMVIIIV